MTQEPSWSVEFYTDARGRSPAREFIRELSERERAGVVRAIRMLEQLGITLGMPYARSIEGHRGLWELRPDAVRVFYFLHTGRRFVVLHAFRKKEQKTPQREIDIAERRRADYLERNR